MCLDADCVFVCVVQNADHLLIFAAGNLGDDMTGCSIASPAIGKNCLAVGSSMSGLSRLSPGDMDVVSDFSSIGPTPDERIKPDVLAPGHFVSFCFFATFTQCSCLYFVVVPHGDAG